MNILVFGGTRFFGKHLVRKLMKSHRVTIVTRGIQPDDFGNGVSRMTVDRTDSISLQTALSGKEFDVVYDNIAYCSEDVKRLLDIIHTQKYILTSSTAVYEKKPGLMECDFDPAAVPVAWRGREDCTYREGKQEAERALYQCYPRQQGVTVRFPFVIGTDDYTKRLQFYVEHTVKRMPMYIDNPDANMSFIHSQEAGEFLAFLADKDVSSPVNGASDGVASLREIMDDITKKTGAIPVLTKKGEAAPYNGEREYSICTEKAQQLGFQFRNVRDHIFPLIDFYCEELLSTHRRST